LYAFYTNEDNHLPAAPTALHAPNKLNAGN